MEMIEFGKSVVPFCFETGTNKANELRIWQSSHPQPRFSLGEERNVKLGLQCLNQKRAYFSDITRSK